MGAAAGTTTAVMVVVVGAATYCQCQRLFYRRGNNDTNLFFYIFLTTQSSAAMLVRIHDCRQQPWPSFRPGRFSTISFNVAVQYRQTEILGLPCHWWPSRFLISPTAIFSDCRRDSPKILFSLILKFKHHWGVMCSISTPEKSCSSSTSLPTTLEPLEAFRCSHIERGPLLYINLYQIEIGGKVPSRHRNQGISMEKKSVTRVGLPAVDAGVQSESESVSYISYIEEGFALEIWHGFVIEFAGAVGTGRMARVRRNACWNPMMRWLEEGGEPDSQWLGIQEQKRWFLDLLLKELAPSKRVSFGPKTVPVFVEPMEKWWGRGMTNVWRMRIWIWVRTFVGGGGILWLLEVEGRQAFGQGIVVPVPDSMGKYCTCLCQYSSATLTGMHLLQAMLPVPIVVSW